jgi:hypothetical protein
LYGLLNFQRHNQGGKLMQPKIMEAIRNALEGSRKVKITFKQEATFDLNYLLEMGRVGIISVEGDKLLLMSIAHCGHWESNSNRTVVITLTEKFDPNWFINRMHKCLESIEVIN